MRNAARHLLLALVLGGACAAASAQSAGVPPDELEKRGAASVFILGRHAGLAVLRDECEFLLPAGEFERGARGWLERNREDIEAALTWIAATLEQLKRTDVAGHAKVSESFTASMTRSVSGVTRQWFGRQAPTAASCDAVLRQFVLPQLDFRSMGANQGYEQFAEFGETMQRYRREAGYKPVATAKAGYEDLHFGLVASLDAAQAAREAGDIEGARVIYVSLAQRGEGTSAQTLGILYLNPQYAGRDDLQAYRWFYAAWSLADYEGLNAMGVMLRDGRAAAANPRLAWGAFLLAATMARNDAARSRAQANATRLEPQMAAADRQALACTSLAELDLALRKPVEALPFVRGRSMAQPQLRLGQMLRPLANGTAPCS
ncbi:MAG: hypothetical protein V4757_09425 [Pseudomonadota bacterium]